jgi:hypothetical protein
LEVSEKVQAGVKPFPIKYSPTFCKKKNPGYKVVVGAKKCLHLQRKSAESWGCVQIFPAIAVGV